MGGLNNGDGDIVKVNITDIGEHTGTDSVVLDSDTSDGAHEVTTFELLSNGDLLAGLRYTSLPSGGSDFSILMQSSNNGSSWSAISFLDQSSLSDDSILGVLSIKNIVQGSNNYVFVGTGTNDGNVYRLDFSSNNYNDSNWQSVFGVNNNTNCESVHDIQYRQESNDILINTGGSTDQSATIFLSRDLGDFFYQRWSCLLYTSPSPRDRTRSRMPSSA